MEKESLFEILLKKSWKDIKSNIKQFISIIFIIGIAVTLFVGLQANYQSLKTRVDDFYSEGNIASYWLNYGMVDDIEEKNINNVMSFDVETNKRLSLNVKIEGKNATLCIGDTYPTISKSYELFKDGTSNDSPYKKVENIPEDEKDYFMIDVSFFTFFYDDNNDQDFEDRFKADKSDLNISFSISQYKDPVLESLDNALKSFKDYMEAEDFEKLTSITKNYVSNYFDTHANIQFKAKYTNYMLHPENIAADNTMAPLALMSRDRFMNSLDNVISEAIIGLRSEYEAANVTDINRLMYYVDKITTNLLHSNNQILLKVNEDRYLKDAGRILDDYFNQKNDENGFINKLIYKTDLDNLVSNLTVSNDVQQAYDLSLTFPIIFMIVAVLIVITTISQLILKERQQIGTFKALGLTKGEILSEYLMITLTVSLIGIIAGVIIGPFLLPAIMDIKYLILYSITPTSYIFPWVAVLATTLGILAVVALITFLIVNKELRITPVESMRPAAPKMKLKAKKNSKPGDTKFMSMKIALRNIKVYFTKSIMVIIGIMGCTGLLVCGYGIEDTLNYGVDNDLDKYFNYDIMVNYSNFSINGNELLMENPTYASRFDENKVYNMTTLPASLFVVDGTYYQNTAYILDDKTIKDQVFKAEFDHDTVAISKFDADNMNLHVGDKVKFNLLNKTYERKIGLIYENFSMKSLLIHAEGDFKEIHEKFVTGGYFRFKEGLNLNEEEKVSIVNSIKKLDNVEVANAMTYKQTVDKINSYISSVQMMTGAIKVFAILLAVVCLINLALLNFKERTRDIATLKVLGFSLPEIARSLIYEVLILTVIGSLIGLSLGYPLLYLMLSINQNNYVSFIYYISPYSYIIGVGLAVVTSFLVNLVLSFFINKVPMVESLKSVE